VHEKVNVSHLQVEVCQALSEVNELEVDRQALHLLVAEGDASPLATQLPLLRVLKLNKISENSQQMFGRRVNSTCRALRARVVPVQCIHVVDDIQERPSYTRRLQAVADEVVWDVPEQASYAADDRDEKVGEDEYEDIGDENEYRYFGDGIQDYAEDGDGSVENYYDI
jgi:hypothetical protein